MATKKTANERRFEAAIAKAARLAVELRTIAADAYRAKEWSSCVFDEGSHVAHGIEDAIRPFLRPGMERTYRGFDRNGREITITIPTSDEPAETR